MPFIFISYSHKDSEYANRLADSLEAKGLDTWIDEHIDYGAAWSQAIQEQLDKCAALVVVMTPDSFQSEWVQNELAYAMSLRKPVFPVQLAGPIWLAVAARQVASVVGGVLPPISFYSRLAGLLATGQAQAAVASSLRERLQAELGDLQGRYDNLSRRIAAVNTDLGRALDSEHKLTLEERRAELAGKRDEISARMAQIERVLAEQPASDRDAPELEQKSVPPTADDAKTPSKPATPVKPAAKRKAVAPPVDVAKDEAKPKPVAQVEAALPQPATPVKPAAKRKAVTPPVDVAKDEAKPKPIAQVEAARPELLIIDKPFRLELVRVAAGEFLMGSGSTWWKDRGVSGSEKPQHRLYLPEFYIGKYPVTNGQYAVFVKQTQAAAPSHWKMWKTPVVWEQHPVVGVSWYEATAFCRWVSQETNETVRLASEAEWEKAARGVDGRVYPWGNEAPSAEFCNFNNNMGITTPVDLYRKGVSPYGVLDMAGNVWEWTLSLWGKDWNKPKFRYPYNPTDGREDLQAAGDIHRVVRGGSYWNFGDGVNCASRSGYYPPDLRYPFVGFRVVCVSPPHHASGL